uniref:Small nuclear ribonucleoprotein Sm D3 n=2 Tax=Lygus hesperus TaxID=30085 RepID=A0A0A9WKK7_LYGHE
MSLGVPVKVLHEAEGHIVTCEIRTGEVYRGKLVEAEDNMNCRLSAATVTFRDGRVVAMENVYVRGSKIRFLILPDMIQNAPMFRKLNPAKNGQSRPPFPKSQGRGRGMPLPMRDNRYPYIKKSVY